MADQSSNRASGPTPGRFELDLTRTCIGLGRVLATQGLMEALSAGEVTLHDVNADQPVTLTFEPPRTLRGLGPFFERHNLRPNDRLILTLHENGGEIDMYRRPAPVRATRPEPEGAHEPEGPRAVERFAAYGGSLPEARERAAERAAEEEEQIGRVRVRQRPAPQQAGPAEALPEQQGAHSVPEPVWRAPEPEPQSLPEEPPRVRPKSRTASRPSASKPAEANPAPYLPPGGAVDRGSVAEVVRLRLEEPGVPAIVRTAKLAEALNCDPDLVEKALADLSHLPDSGVDRINDGIYRHTVLTRSK